MPTKTASGFILAHVKGDAPRYLLLQSSRHGGWGFPKGHSDPGETELETARRETLEETGIAEVRPIDGFVYRCEYDVRNHKRGAYHKVVSYFLGVTDQDAHVLSDEHSHAGWFGRDEALKLLDFPMLREALSLADAHLRKVSAAG